MSLPKIDIASILSAIDFSAPSWDLFIVLFFVVAVLLYGLTLGRDRVLTILISIYMALAVVNTAPYLSTLKAEVNLGQMFALKVVAFLGLFVILFFLLARSALLHNFSKGGLGSWMQVFIFSVLHVGLLTSATLSFLPITAVEHLAPTTQLVFTSDMGRFAWIILPIIAMILLKDRD
ncbi:MAG: hypothetical protein U9P90_04160 [Patescibacteria group bacterium]|nr:hypothetical protein [Patescibacteria group bacterium]